MYRQQKLESFGYTFLRFYEGEVLQNIGAVKERIDYAIFCLRQASIGSPPLIPPQGGKKRTSSVLPQGRKGI